MEATEKSGKANIVRSEIPAETRRAEDEMWTAYTTSDSDKYLPPEKLAQKISVGAIPDRFSIDSENIKNTIHIVAQSKGGTGKTFVSSVLAGFFARHVPDLPLYCFDLDSNKRSFSAFKAFNVMQINEIVPVNGEIVIDPSRFDVVFNNILESMEDDSVVVIDTGAGTSFWSLVQYLANLDYPSLCRSCGDKEWRFVVDVVISGGAREESVETIRRLRRFLNSPFVEYTIWGNEYFGRLDKLYEEIAGEFSEVGNIFKRNVNLPQVTNRTLDSLLRYMRENNLSASEMFMSSDLNKLQKSYIIQYFYGNDSGKPGVFRALQNLDWSASAGR